MRRDSQTIGGIYLVLDPGMEKETLLHKLKEALEGGVSIVQVWNNWPASFNLSAKQDLIQSILQVAADYHVPVLINEEWELLKGTGLAGVHFDKIPEDYEAIKADIKRDFICGITCSNSLEVVRWAEHNQLDYVSFCSMYPSGSVGSCEIVRPETVKRARDITHMPFFLSGGITAENLVRLKELHFAGVAVISGILSAASPKESTAAYKNALSNLNSKI
ncbi:thiamine phosphate synthase [Pontibacter pamirensis]|uniref:thiamine phosphate synthase n=1 Tax=Pontibacter pamirensis TaxID=2562824 RepID=UPI00138A3331|nr:thiamine phosphate synthase [Pontibacter pamirensis]